MELADDKLLFEGMVVEAEGYEATAEKEEQRGALPGNLRQAYIQFYEDAIAPKFRQIPTHTVKFDEDELDLVFDLGLFEQLFDVYITEGWQGIVTIEKSILSSAGTDAAALQRFMKGKGMVLNEWNYSVLFFHFTRNMLAIIIRNALLSMEKTASRFIYQRIMHTYGEIANQWRKYDIRPYVEITTTDTVSSKGHETVEEQNRYKAGNAIMLQDLAALMTTTLKASHTFLRQLQELMDVNQRITNLESTGRPNYSPSSTYEQDLKQRTSLQHLNEQAEKLLNELRQVLQKNHPVGMLLLPLLSEPVTEADLGNTLGATLDALRKEIEAMSKQLNAQTNYTEQWMPFSTSRQIMRDILSFKVPAKGPEAALLDMAMKRFQDTGMIALLNEDVLVQLINDEIIPPGTVEWVVSYQYFMLLNARLEEKAKQEQEKNQIWKKIERASAGLSVASLLAGVALAPELMTIAGLALIYHAVDSVGQGLKQRDVLLRNALLRNDSQSFQGMSRLGELVRFKKDVLDGLEGQLLIELLSIVATRGVLRSTGFARLKTSLIMKFYMDDVSILWDGVTEQE